MERAARVLNSIKIANKVLPTEELARAVWPTAVGKVIAAHTSRLRMVRSTLIVEVEDATWQKQLFTLSRQIVERLRKATGNDSITDIEFRVGIQRREPQRADASGNAIGNLRSTGLGPLDLQDEAESIQDPVLKKVYRLSRKKAIA